jgi:hypothetical protein
METPIPNDGLILNGGQVDAGHLEETKQIIVNEDHTFHI